MVFYRPISVMQYWFNKWFVLIFSKQPMTHLNVFTWVPLGWCMLCLCHLKFIPIKFFITTELTRDLLMLPFVCFVRWSDWVNGHNMQTHYVSSTSVWLISFLFQVLWKVFILFTWKTRLFWPTTAYRPQHLSGHFRWSLAKMSTFIIFLIL